MIEFLGGEGRGKRFCLGLGVNIVSAPQGLDYATARLCDVDGAVTPTPAVFARAVDECFDLWRRRWRETGFAPIRAAWLGAAAFRGETLIVRAPQATWTGVFVDIDEGGGLILDSGNETRRIAAGAVFPAMDA